MARNKKKIALNALTLGGLVASQVGLFATPASATDGVVANCGDSGAGSLRALLDANNLTGGGTITFDAALNCDTINVLTPLYIDRDVNIVGPGADDLTIQPDDAITTGTIWINSAAEANENLSDVSISGLTVVAPHFDQGFPTAAIGVDQITVLDINESQLEMNLTVSDSHLITRGIYSKGIYARLTGESLITITGSEFENNSDYFPYDVTGLLSIGANVNIENSYFHDLSGYAVSIRNNSSANSSTITNSTFESTRGIEVTENGDLEVSNIYYDNTNYSAYESNAAIYSVGHLTVENSTIVSNIFSEGSLIAAGGELVLAHNTLDVLGRLTEYPHDGILFSAPELTLYGNIVASEQSDALTCEPNNWGGSVGTVNDLGGNLFTNAGCGVTAVGAQSDGSSGVVSWSELDLQEPALNTEDPTNSFDVKTIELGQFSVARDYYSNSQLDLGSYPAINKDARGTDRPFNGKNDVGAYEYSDGVVATAQNLGGVKFKAYSSVLTKAAKAKLRGIASEIVAGDFGRVVLNGYTSTDSSSYSWAANSRRILSEKRAKAVKRFLVKQLAKSDVTVEFKIHAKALKDPKASNKTKTGRAKNRRVEIVVKPAVG